MFRFWCGLVLALWTTTACAADQPLIAPPAAWVKPTAIPTPPPVAADDGAPVRRLLTDIQTRFDAGGDERFTEAALRIQTPAGLAAGNIVVNWQPDTDTLTIHHVRIIRGDQVIDVLAAGQTFAVLRRETNLELAMLDGVLTAALQPEGLQVGDVIDFAYTVKHHDPAMGGESELGVALLPGPPSDRLFIREIWPSSTSMRWREQPGIAAPVIVKTAAQSELTVDMANAERPKPPKGAPARYSQSASLETTEFSDWAAISALMAPLYDKASTLPANSPLRAEAAKIAAASTDPGARAAAALKLVQSRVRYVFLGMNDGGYVPAAADVTWSRRFGDCKGKTALLLALLKALDIQAEPALVSTVFGDGLDEHLPLVEYFDHVMVRASVGGKTYWLDGTRLGDRGLDDLQEPPYHWALPLQAGGAALERLVVPPLALPADETTIRIDASGGLYALAPAHVETIVRGDMATQINLGFSSMARADADQKMRELWKSNYAWIEIKHTELSYDDKTGEEHMVMDGAASMGWSTDPETLAPGFQADGVDLTSSLDFTRDPGPGEDAPFAVPYPGFSRTTEIVILPQGGKGFSVVGDPVEKTVAGVEFKRTARIDGGAFTVEASRRSISPEIPAADAPAAKIALRDLASQSVQMHAPVSYAQTDAETAVRLKREPTLASEFEDRADARVWSGQYALAVADFDRANQLKPADAQTLNARCFGRAEAGRDLDLALADCNAALGLDPKSAMTLDSRAFVYFRLGQINKAVVDLDAALAVAPKQAASLYVRGLAERRKGQKARGQTDIAAATALYPMVAQLYDHFGVTR